MIRKEEGFLILSLVLISSLCCCFGYKTDSENDFFSTQKLINVSNLAPIVIIGSGPAGLMSAVYGARGGKKTYVVEGDKPGGLLMDTTEVENWPGEVSIKGPEIIEKMRAQAEHQGAQFISGAVEKIDTTSWPYRVFLDDGTALQAMSIIVATGSSPRRLNIPGEDEHWGAGVTACAVCDAPFFKNEEVVVVGGGDSAVEEAIQLTPFAKKITILVRKGQMRAAASMQARLKNYPKISVLHNVEPRRIKGDLENVQGVELYNNKTGDVNLFPASGVFLAIGHIPNTPFLKGSVNLNADGTIKINSPRHETSKQGIFAAGDVADSIYRQAGTSSGDGSAAGLDAVRFLDDIGYTNQVAQATSSRLYTISSRSINLEELLLLESEDDFEKLLAEAQDKPVVIEFWTEDCSTCKQLKPWLQEAAMAYKDKMIFAQVNAENLEDLAHRLGALKAPTIIVLKGGKVVEKSGFLPKAELDLFLSTIK